VKNPTKYFTEEVMKALETAAAKEFKYGSDQEGAADEPSETVEAEG
jgi:hypothetical protein